MGIQTQQLKSAKNHGLFIAHGANGKLADLALSKVCDLNTPSDRAPKELQNACFNFEKYHSKLKLWALKDDYQNRTTKKTHKAYGAKAKAAASF